MSPISINIRVNIILNTSKPGTTLSIYIRIDQYLKPRFEHCTRYAV